MKREFNLTTARAVEIFGEMIACRRAYCADKQFFRMTEVWEWLCEESDLWSIKPYRSSRMEDFKRKASVVAFGDRATLTVDEKLLANARQGCKLSNFILAHELGHVALDHHARGAITRNFQLFAGPNGMSNSPPTLEELEANYAAVFFQCGVSLADPRFNALELAHRAFSDVYYVRKAQGIVQLGVFQEEMHRSKTILERVIL